MTEEQPTEEAVPAEDPQPQRDPSELVFSLWATYFDAAKVLFVGDTVNKRDQQVYRLKAADIAYALTELTLKVGIAR